VTHEDILLEFYEAALRGPQHPVCLFVVDSVRPRDRRLGFSDGRHLSLAKSNQARKDQAYWTKARRAALLASPASAKDLAAEHGVSVEMIYQMRSRARKEQR
jgi:hypothetical protein